MKTEKRDERQVIPKPTSLGVNQSVLTARREITPPLSAAYDLRADTHPAWETVLDVSTRFDKWMNPHNLYALTTAGALRGWNISMSEMIDNNISKLLINKPPQEVSEYFLPTVINNAAFLKLVAPHKFPQELFTEEFLSKMASRDNGVEEIVSLLILYPDKNISDVTLHPQVHPVSPETIWESISALARSENTTAKEDVDYLFSLCSAVCARILYPEDWKRQAPLPWDKIQERLYKLATSPLVFAEFAMWTTMLGAQELRLENGKIIFDTSAETSDQKQLPLPELVEVHL